MKIIVGLGNPGEKYSQNRHNVGFILLDTLAKKLGLEWDFSSKLKADICKRDDLIFLKSREYMNTSGQPVSSAVSYYKISASDLLVIHDDIDLPFGEVKMQFASGSAGHKGVESIISNLGSKEFWRIRVGVGRPTNAQPVEDFVLSNFSDEELQKIKEIDLEELLSQK
jgi:PTH1 family peptidyl-tRNA hydrolase